MQATGAKMSPHWEIGTVSEAFEPIARIDPYIVWAHATRYRDLGGMPRGRIPIAIEMKQGGETAQQFAQTIERNGWQRWIWMSALYRDPPAGLEATRFCTAHVTREFFAHLNTDLAGKFERFTEALAISTHVDARTERVPADHAPMREGLGNAIVGVCDEDIAFTHPRFSEDANGTRTRFQCFWNQNDPADSAQPGSVTEASCSNIRWTRFWATRAFMRKRRAHACTIRRARNRQPIATRPCR